MSKSRKKVPSYSDYSRNYTKWAKRQASKSVRRYQGELTDGCVYKKIFNSWNIFDYKGIWISRNYGWGYKGEVPSKAYRK